jgi:DNA mismatch repair protein MutL
MNFDFNHRSETVTASCQLRLEPSQLNILAFGKELSQSQRFFKIRDMTHVIQTLSNEVIQLIAAGEVIDSLAAAVRELVENALDAGASRIWIAVWPEQWRVSVTDNGYGLTLANLQQAAKSHATSKIHTREDLHAIGSLGFRGEGLHSLALLSNLEICSRPATSVEGWRVRYDVQGEMCWQEPVAIAAGTIVTASQIFGTWAARRQSLPSLAQQLRSIQLTIQDLALCHPAITWRVRHNDRDWFTLWPGETAQDILPQLIRQLERTDLRTQTLTIDLPDNLSELVLGQTTALQLTLGLPDRCHRHRPDWVRVAVNHRVLKLPELEQVLLSTLRRTLPRDRFPICFAHLLLPPVLVDWNRHPAKTEVYLRQMDVWQQALERSIEQVLALESSHLPEPVQTQRVSQLLRTAEAKAGYAVQRTISADLSDRLAMSPSPAIASSELDINGASSVAVSAAATHQLRAVAQVHNTYILAEHSSGFWLVEQHIAHERVLYEQICERWQLVELSTPLLLNRLSDAQQEQLQRLGLRIEPFGEKIWAARTAPELLADRTDCAEALLELSLGGDLKMAQVATACRSAIRNGTPLTLAEMQTLLAQWQQTRHPRTCPHGRPIYLALDESALARFFRRHWVIGKSHGI